MYKTIDNATDEYADEDDNSTDSEILDPFFKSEHILTVGWIASNAQANDLRNVMMMIECDYDFRTSQGKTTKCVLFYGYVVLTEVMDPVTSDYMRVGVYGPGLKNNFCGINFKYLLFLKAWLQRI